MAIITKDGIEGKVCSKCEQLKPLTDFYTDRTHGPTQRGTHCRCKVCQREDHGVRYRLRAR